MKVISVRLLPSDAVIRSLFYTKIDTGFPYKQQPFIPPVKAFTGINGG